MGRPRSRSRSPLPLPLRGSDCQPHCHSPLPLQLRLPLPHSHLDFASFLFFFISHDGDLPFERPTSSSCGMVWHVAWHGMVWYSMMMVYGGKTKPNRRRKWTPWHSLTLPA